MTTTSMLVISAVILAIAGVMLYLVKSGALDHDGSEVKLQSDMEKDRLNSRFGNPGATLESAKELDEHFKSEKERENSAYEYFQKMKAEKMAMPYTPIIAPGEEVKAPRWRDAKTGRLVKRGTPGAVIELHGINRRGEGDGRRAEQRRRVAKKAKNA